MTIPASDIVSILPGVISAGGSPLALNTILLTANANVPVGAVMPFTSATQVGNYFGFSSLEYQLATIYFLSNDNSSVKPYTLYFVQCPQTAVAAYALGASLPALTLITLQGFSGTLSVNIGGTVYTSGNINLAAAVSFSDAAARITAAFTAPALPGTVSYNSQLQAFQITTTATGAAATISAVGGTIAPSLALDAADGGVTSQGAVAVTGTGPIAAFMTGIIKITQNWALFMSTFEPSTSDALAYSAWVNSTNNRYAYVSWDSDPNAIVANSTTTFVAQAKALNYSGVIPCYNTPQLAALICGIVAGIDFTGTNTRITAAFKSQTGFAATVFDQNTADNLEANGYNFYGAYATANQAFNFLYPGSCLGPFKWIDTYVNQIYLNAQFQLAFMTLLTQIKIVPQNTKGSALMRAAAQDPINQFVTFGGIQGNVTLSTLQAAEVDQEAGVTISPVLSARGWYLQVLTSSAQVRAARGTPPCTFWYTDGGAVQRISMQSLNVQ